MKIEEINGILYIDGIDIIKKVSDLSKEADRLKAENEKQKEVIDKAIEYIEKEDEPLYINEWDTLYDGTYFDNYVESDFAKDILDILKEVSE